MSSLPTMPVGVDRHIADTAHMTNEEAGAYFRLQIFAWRSPGCCLPDDDARFARMLGTTLKRWAVLKPIVLANWVLENGNWSNQQVAREHQFVSEKVERKRAAGRKGGRPKPLQLHDQEGALGSAIEEEMESKTKAAKAKAKSTPIVPTGDEDPEGFAEFKAAYPKRSSVFPTTLARKRWLEARRRGATPAEIIAGTKAYAAEQERIGKVGSEFVKTADAWLHQQRWRDYAPKVVEAGSSSEISADVWRERVKDWKARGGHWPWQQRTEPPDDPRTKVPAQVLAEIGIVHGNGADRAAQFQRVG
ncbi:DUF1376 domain-containing protein [Methylobacterium sp. E-041]|uniref:DUF1376 domain-containing protein n=1 Tax=Methylobacterium sp. E-041 TaxID=2836573 RepID=UPI001FBAD0AB|nr:DUF1376 domain-containing protein [Methylobacterium sp. E-041]MCJ2105696.1 DUF1376 domain-containing protein [Methylobacterium sp. E-041]